MGDRVTRANDKLAQTTVEALSSLMEPVIMVVLGTLIGGMVVAMYLLSAINSSSIPPLSFLVAFR